MNIALIEKAFDFLVELVRREVTTMPGLVNLVVLGIAAAGTFTVGSLEALESVIRAIRGEDGSSFNALVISIAILLTLLMCMTILAAAEKARNSSE